MAQAKCMLHCNVAGRCEPDTLRRALQQGHAGRRFEVRQTSAGRRQRKMALRCTLGDTARLRDKAEQAQRHEVDAPGLMASFSIPQV
jgi:hypothetical protein